MNPKNRSLRPKPLACAALALLFVPLAGVSAPQASAAVYDNVDDILNGHHFLLQEDDLVVTAKVGNYAMNQDLLYTSDSGIVSKNSQQPKLNTGLTANGTAVVAYMYRNAPPVVVYGLQGSGSNSPFLDVRSTNPKFGAFETVALAGPPKSTVRQLVVGDFNGDGLDDILAVHGNGYLTICTAKNPNSYDLRLRCGPTQLHGDYPSQRLTAGDFRGIGRAQFAWAYQRPGSSTSTVWIAEVDPGTLAVNGLTNYEGLPTGALNTLDITAGKFAAPGNTQHQQLAFAYAGSSGTAKVDIINFASGPFRVSTVKTWDTGYTPGGNEFSKIILKAAPFAGFNLYDQIAMLVSENKYTQFLAVLEVDPNTLAVTKTAKSAVFLSNLGVSSWKVSDMTIGNFDHKNSGGGQNPNMQIAIAGWSNGPKGPKFWNAYLFNVNPEQDYNITLQQQFVEQNATPQINGARDTILTIAAVDVQGRSINLGPPTKIVINEQGGPSLVTAVPPMHVDYIAPEGSATPTLLNLSAIKKGFSTSYNMEKSSQDQSTSKSSDSYSWGFEESIEAQLTIGNPKANHISAGLNFAAQQTFENGVEKEYTSSGGAKFNASVQTGSSDSVWYDQSRLNIYSYPVLGQMVCPSAKPDNCAAADKAPLTIQFSAIDVSKSAVAAGSQIEWYQPVWEYGNVLSYPASYSQLRLLYPNIEELAEGRTFFTDENTSSATATWSNGSSGSESVSSARRFAEGGGLSVAGAIAVPIIPAGGIGGAFEFNVSGSQAFERLNTSVTELGSSSGITVDKPGDFREPRNYAYSITPYIFGLSPRAGTVDKPKLAGDIQTAGPVQAAFVADPLLTNSGSWWETAYSKAPDVALNHPARWVFTQDSAASTPNCVGGTCVSLAAGDATKPWKSDFHAMRGFFISDAASPGQGPQLSTAFAGERLELEARVYNYSLVDMPASSKVHVRFYAQRMAKNEPSGASSLIGETELAPIPPFSDAKDAPLNSVLARTTFDTSNYADQRVAFWVVTWMQDENGALVKEPDGHGLLGIPGTLTSLADVKAEQYSNNVGFYKRQIYVMPRPASTATNVSEQSSRLAMAAQTGTTFSSAATSVAPPNSSLAAALQSMELINLEVSSGHTGELDTEVDVSTDLQAGTDPIPGATVIFYDGDPKNGGEIFDMEDVPYVKANETLPVEVNFRAQTCGSHDLYAVTYQGTEYEKVSEPFVLQIDCSK